jgi:hypothetical protein
MLHIDKPCPIANNQLRNDAKGLACLSCKKNIIDFRNASREEIIAQCNSNVCGIFNASQLDATPVLSWQNKILFRALAIFSFFGIAITPVKAQSQATQPREGKIRLEQHDQQKNAESLDKKKKKEERKYHRKRRKQPKEYRVIGCPSF